LPHVVFEEDLSYIEKQIAEIKNKLSDVENIIRRIRGEEQKKTPHEIEDQYQTQNAVENLARS
jgi:hypothetical protein